VSASHAGPIDEVFWFTQRQPKPVPLSGDIGAVDVVVVGGGMAGLMCARAAHTRGLSVVVLEMDWCGAGASGKSSGFITPDSELELSDLVGLYGPHWARKLWDFALSGCDAIRETVLAEELDCDYQAQDSLYVANSARGERKVRAEYDARQELGCQGTFCEADRVSQVLGAQGYRVGLRGSGTFGIAPYLFCQELKDALTRRGVRIHEGTRVTGLADHALATTGGTIVAGSIVFCADRFLPGLGIVPRDIYHAQTFLGISRPLAAGDRRRMFPDQPLMVWDTELIYQYYRLTGEGRVLIGGASVRYTYARRERHSPGRIARKLQRYLRDHLPEIPIELEYLWPGLIGVSKDLLPVAGRLEGLPHVYYVGGAAGLPWAAALGVRIADRIVEDARSPLDDLFVSARRYPVPYGLQATLGKPIAFAVSHAIVKY